MYEITTQMVIDIDNCAILHDGICSSVHSNKWLVETVSSKNLQTIKIYIYISSVCCGAETVRFQILFAITLYLINHFNYLNRKNISINVKG